MKCINVFIHSGYLFNRNGIKPACIFITAFVSLLLLSACTPVVNSDSSGFNQSTGEFKTNVAQPDVIMSPLPKSSLKNNECPALDSQLYQLSQTEDPSGTAGKLGYRLIDEKVQVLIILKDENTSFLADFKTEVGTQSGTQVQAYVPFDQLCPLAKYDSVLAVRPAAQAIQ